MAKEVRIDPAVLELAKWLLHDDPCRDPELRDHRVQDLATFVQRAVNGWFFFNSDIEHGERDAS